jgi:3-oxoacyl-[acyl-carrier protein] reductase
MGFSLVANVFESASEAAELEREFRASGAEAVAVAGDMTDPADAATLVATALERFGGVDLLVNNAGGGEICPFEQMQLPDWRRVVDSNLTSTFVVASEAVTAMKRQGGGRIINISSQQAFKGAPRLAHYCAAKAGVVGFTRALALELAPYGITVNAIAPGPIATDGHARAGVTEEELRSQIAGLPLGRLGRPDEVAESVMFLAQSPSGDFYTGQTLHINGGEVMP